MRQNPKRYNSNLLTRINLLGLAQKKVISRVCMRLSITGQAPVRKDYEIRNPHPLAQSTARYSTVQYLQASTVLNKVTSTGQVSNNTHSLTPGLTRATQLTYPILNPPT